MALTNSITAAAAAFQAAADSVESATGQSTLTAAFRALDNATNDLRAAIRATKIEAEDLYESRLSGLPPTEPLP